MSKYAGIRPRVGLQPPIWYTAVDGICSRSLFCEGSEFVHHPRVFRRLLPIYFAVQKFAVQKIAQPLAPLVKYRKARGATGLPVKNRARLSSGALAAASRTHVFGMGEKCKRMERVLAAGPPHRGEVVIRTPSPPTPRRRKVD